MHTVILSIISIIALISSLVLIKKLIFVKIAIVWWLFWLNLSLYSIGGINPPSTEVYLLFLLIPLGTLIGALIASSLSNKLNLTRSINHYSLLEFRILFIAKYILMPLVIVMLCRSVYLLYLNGFSSQYREIALGVSDDSNISLFLNDRIQILFTKLVTPLCYLTFFVGIAEIINRKNSNILIIGIILLFSQSIIFFGRFGIYVVTFFLIISSIIASNLSNSNINRKYIFTISVSLILIFYISYLRTDVSSIINTIVNQHTLGFALFDNEYRNSRSLLNTHTSYGLAILNDLFYWINLLLRRIDPSLITPAQLIGVKMHSFQQVGVEIGTGLPILANAYTTIMYPIYLDGGLIMVILFSIVFGYFFAKHELKSQRNKSVYYTAVVIVFFYIYFNGLFMPSITYNSLSLFLILYALKNFTINPRFIYSRYN